MKKMAESRGGRMVPSKWRGSSESYEFIDATNHTFVSDYNNVMRGRWSPHEGKISEPLCRQVMEHLFGGDFPSTRSVLLPEINGSEYAWELDGYCEEKRIAFEYQGHPSHWSPEDPNYAKTSHRDAQKKYLCDQLGITLVQIPAFTKGSIWAENRVYQHVLDAVKSVYAHPQINAAPFEPDFTCLNKGIKQLEQLRRDAALYGLKVKDTNYPYPEFRFTLIDEHGACIYKSHRSLQKKKRLDFLMIDAIAQERGCVLLEEEYLGARALHKVQTPFGDTNMTGETIKNNFPGNLKTYIGKKTNVRLQRLSLSGSTQSLESLLDTMRKHGIEPSPKSLECLESIRLWHNHPRSVVQAQICEHSDLEISL